jgi:ectonucleotide pyrophosphatase/phosphodiesterase family protein 5
VSRIRVVDASPNSFLIPEESYVDEVVTALTGAHPNMTVYKKEQIPERYQFRNNR